MKSTQNKSLIIIIVLLSIASICFGQTTKENIVLGKSLSIESQVLGETRDFYIYLPEGYEQTKDNYPVMYVLDGETNFLIATAIVNFLARNQQIPQTIVVGIPNVARGRDFTPNTGKDTPNSGGADNFIKFLEQELITYVDNTYRTQDYKVLFGHSLCGMFSVYSLFTNPNLVNAHIAASPYLMLSDEYVISKVEEVLDGKSNLTNQIYMSIGNEPAYFNSLEKLTSLLKANDLGVNWTLEKYLEEDHGTIPFITISDGLRFVFSDWPLTNEIAMEGIGAIKNHFAKREEKYGFTTEITEVLMNRIGYQLLQLDKNKKAVEVFKYNVEKYPKSANVYDSLGDGYDAQGLKKKALESYRKAVSIGEKTDDPNLAVYKNNVERLETAK